VFIEIAKLLLNNLGNLCTCCLFCHLAAAFLLRPAFTFSVPRCFLLGFLALAWRCFFSFLLAAPLFSLAYVVMMAWLRMLLVSVLRIGHWFRGDFSIKAFACA